MRKERRRTLINSDVAGHKVPLVMLGTKDKKCESEKYREEEAQNKLGL